MGGDVDRDLAPFTEDNAKWRSKRRRVPWQHRVEQIEEQFPSVKSDWNVILRDDDVFGRLLRDILKIDQIDPGRAGPRPNLDYDRGMQSWRELTGEDFCQLPFPRAFKAITYKQSLTQVARKTGISRSRVDRLLKEQDRPTVDDMRQIAKAYGKKPAFFAEYRTEYIIASMVARLEYEYELTVTIYKKLLQG